MNLEIHDVFISFLRWAVGLALGAAAGLLLSFIATLFRPVREFFLHTAGFLRALPILGLAPLVSLYFGVGEVAKVSLIAWACAFPVFVSTTGTVSKQMEDLELRMDVLRMLRASRLRHYDSPRVLFGFLNGVEISIGIGWLSVVAAEYMIGTFNTGPFRGGLGRAVFDSFNNHDEGVGMACLLIFGVLGLSTSYLWRSFSRWLVVRLGFDRASLLAK
jgi:sulfonate transport system permease protein